MNSHALAGESGIFLIGKYQDKFSLESTPLFVERIVQLDTRRLDKGQSLADLTARVAVKRLMASEKNWQRLCAMNELAGGGLKRFEVAGIVVLATRVNDTTRVIPPFCPHMAEPLIESGICSGATLTCSKHLWQWNLESAEMQGAAGEAADLLSVRGARRRVVD